MIESCNITFENIEEKMYISSKNFLDELTLFKCEAGFTARKSNQKCYMNFDEEMEKPDAKKVCFDLGAELILVTSNAENDYFSEQLKSDETVWMRINDGKVEGEWVVDRVGYEKSIYNPPGKDL